MITLNYFGNAYRNAQVDLYSSSHASLDAIVEYEENLYTNLFALHEKIEEE